MTGEERKLRAYKFIIPKGKPREIAREAKADGTGDLVLEADGLLAVAVHYTQEEARALLQRVEGEAGNDVRWLAVADVLVLDLDSPKRLCSAAV